MRQKWEFGNNLCGFL